MSEPELDQEIGVYPIHESSNKPLLQNGMVIEDLTLNVDTYTEDQGDRQIEWTLSHKKGFPTFLNRHFAGPDYHSPKADFLDKIIASRDAKFPPPFPYQRIIYEYLRYGTPNRGLLLEHGLGSGKTRSAVMVAESFRRAGLDILVLTPASLDNNMFGEILRWGGEDIRVDETTSRDEIWRRRRTVTDSYKFVHYNASGKGFKSKDAGKGGVFEQLARHGIGFAEGSPQDAKFPYLKKYHRQFPGGLQPPHNMLIIIDEAHGLNTSFLKGAAAAEKGMSGNIRSYLYPLLMQAHDCKIIALSATPMISNPFEMVFMYNILRGQITTSGSKPTSLFPLDEKLFNEMFLSYEEYQFYNVDILMNRIIGLGSYFAGIKNDVHRVIYPAGKDDVEMVPIAMSPYQTHQHDLALTHEIKGGKPKKAKLVGSDEAMSDTQAEIMASSYRSRSRQICNFAFPSSINRPRERVKGTWDDLLMEEDPFEFYLPEQKKSPNTLEELNKLFEFITNQNPNLTYDDDEYANLLTDDSEEGLLAFRVFLMGLLSSAYPNIAEKVPKKIERGSHIMHWLNKKDQQTIRNYLGTYNERCHFAVHKLLNPTMKYLSISKLEKRYSAKMAEIYRRIVGDIANGAPHLVDGALDEEYGPEMISDAVRQVGEAIAPDAEEEKDDLMAYVRDTKASVIDDPDDPFQEHKDVFKSDEEIKRLGKHVEGGPALVYSYFNTVEGVGIFSKILEAHGFEEYHDMTNNAIRGKADASKVSRKPRYAFIVGGMDKNLRQNVIDVFSSKENVHGQLIRVVLVTQAAAEGISLFNLRQIHIMEPDWDNTVIKQVIGRGFRLYAHQYIVNPDHRIIKVWRYIATRSKDEEGLRKQIYPAQGPYHDQFPNIRSDTKSTDQDIQHLANNKDRFVDGATLIRQRAAIDCTQNREYNELPLDAPCLSFAGNIGDAFEIDLIKPDERRAAPRIIWRNTEYGHFIDQGVTYIYNPKLHLAKIRMMLKTKGKGEVPHTTSAYIVYAAPSGWNKGDEIYPENLREAGYRVRLKLRTMKEPMNLFLAAGTKGVVELERNVE